MIQPSLQSGQQQGTLTGAGIGAAAGAGYPVASNEQWSLAPRVSAGYYYDGAGEDLGYDLEFYSQLRLEYRFAAGSRVGLGVGHISNASIGDRNPGAETI